MNGDVILLRNSCSPAQDLPFRALLVIAVTVAKFLTGAGGRVAVADGALGTAGGADGLCVCPHRSAEETNRRKVARETIITSRHCGVYSDAAAVRSSRSCCLPYNQSWRVHATQPIRTSAQPREAVPPTS